MKNNDSKIAIVTGAGSGIGKAVALALLQGGFTVALAGRRREVLAAVAQESGLPEQRWLVAETDVSDPASVDRLFAAVAERFGRLDLLFNNAGVGLPPTPTEDVAFEQWQRVLHTNVTGSFLCAQGAVRLMKAQSPRGGRIINNGSMAAHSPRPDSIAYTATKHAITGLTRSLALDGRKHDIACGQIDIGNALTRPDSPMAQALPQPNGEMLVEPLINVEEVARSVVLMATLPLAANIPFMTIMATNMPFFGRG
jgi:NAD(P)-dependent dehydrogenase (short-subunit alcohol dehydrogenase family)